MACRRAALAMLLVALGAGGCGIGPGLSVKRGDIPGSWVAASCGESMTFAKDGTGTITGFPKSVPSGPTFPTSAVTWKLQTPEDPHLDVSLGDQFWYMHFTRTNGTLHVINDAGGRTCTFSRH